MLFVPKIVELKTQVRCSLRSPRCEDAKSLLEFIKRCSQETNFLLRYKEEYSDSLLVEEGFIKRINVSCFDVMIIAIIDGVIVANCQLNIKQNLKTKHRGSIAICVRKDFWGLGIASKLIDELMALAKENGCEQLELETMETNVRAIRLYEHKGFETYGEIPRAIKLKNNTYLKLILMKKEL